jgi:tripartite-type tricarboxylate transporter receptor subunit TctC
MKILSAAALLASLMVPNLPAMAQPADAYPSKPIRVVVPFPPGGAIDLFARRIGERMRDALGQPIIVDNRPGAGTLIGTEHVARSAADGYTIFLTSPGGLVQAPALYSNLKFDPAKDFTPLIKVADVAVALIVRADLEAKNVSELVDYLRRNPGKTSYASFGAGSTMHIYSENLKKVTGTDSVHVPYKGDAPSMQGLIGGEVQYLFTNPVSAIIFQKQGRVRILAVTGERRVPALPDTPTMAEAGFKGFEPVGWYAYFAPAGLPEPIAKRLHATISDILEAPDMQAFLKEQGTIPGSIGLQEFAATLDAERDTWYRMIKDNGIKVE